MASAAAFFFLVLLVPTMAGTHNTTHILSKYASLSSFNKYLVETGVVKEIDSRSSLTVMAPPNAALDAYIDSIGGPNQLLLIADVLRYHCVLQYLDIPEIRSMSNATGVTMPTLYQTTGRATGTMGFIKVSVSTKTKAIHLGLPDVDAYNATIVTNITQFPYNVSYMQIDHVVAPAGLQNSQAAAASVDAALAELKKKGNFGTALSLLDATGVGKAIKAMSAVTLLVPTDAAFGSVSVGGLSQAEKISLIQYHCIPTYFTFGSLQAVTTPLPTVASSSGGKFALNVSAQGKDGVNFFTGVNNASVVSTELDQPPVAVYSIDKVLLPPEIFAVSPIGAPGPSPFPSPALAPSPNVAPSPTPELSPSPTPEISPSPAPELSPAPAPELSPSPTPAASPPAPPLSPDTSIAAPDSSAPTSPTKSGAMSRASYDLTMVLLIAVSSIVAAATL